MTKENTGVLQTRQPQRGMTAFEILAVLFIAHNHMPIVGAYMPSVVYLGLFGLTFFMALPAFYRKGAYRMLGFFAVSLLTLIIRLNNLTGAATYLYGELQEYLNGLIALVIIAYNRPQNSRRIFWIIICMYVITCITTIIGNNRYPMASRWLATDTIDDAVRQLYIKNNIGNFTFVYRLVFLTPLVIYLIRSKRIKPIIGAGILVLFGITLFATEYGMAVLLFTAGLILLLIPKITTKKIVLILVLVLIFALIFGGFVADVFEKISINVGSEALAERFMVVAEVLRGEDSISSVVAQNRSAFYEKSWNTFLNSNLLGAWGNKQIGNPGGHSFVLDALGNFGLLGVIALIIVFATMHQVALKPYRKQEIYPYLLWIYVIATVLMVLNPKSYGFVFLLEIPLFGHAFSEDKKGSVV